MKCCMLLLFLLAGSALPSEIQAVPLRSLPRQSPNPVQSQALRSHPRPVQSSPPSQHQHTPIFRPSTPVSSGKKTTIPIASKNAPLRSASTPAEKQVEQFAQKLRDEMEAQERVLNTYITTLRKRHTTVEMNLKRVRGILSGLRQEIANATRVAEQYQGEERTQAATANLVSSEYTKSKKMYEDEKQNLKFEKEFLDAIIKYIKLRKKC